MTTDTSENTDRPQSFLSKLRQRSAIIFTIGLAISVASFVENLHMGKAAIAFVGDELSKIQGWEDFVRATAAIFHVALEWWRGVLRDLFSFLPFEVPQWLHDPLSVLFLGISRMVARRGRVLVVEQRLDEPTEFVVRTSSPFARAMLEVVALVILLTSALAVDTYWFRREIEDITYRLASISAVALSFLLLLALILYLVNLGGKKAMRKARMEHAKRHDLA